MRDLSTVRQGWADVEQAEACLQSTMTPQESLRRWLELQRIFGPQLRETAALFGPERRAALADLQSRLRRLAACQERHGKPDTVDPPLAETV